ncbi:hypothetical protein C440_06012 [Haloferax mucosum ATCC BAA-1512]|uniref:Uncharacterized protein n=1 Tax=Haloferax mucosum ATCC BAA-1512 TaxID=662479 RepID=M0IGC1_9EURY|nr:hypothetical protein C440_06012 [Haloferax mucosum ATCC BAA-1512]
MNSVTVANERRSVITGVKNPRSYLTDRPQDKRSEQQTENWEWFVKVVDERTHKSFYVFIHHYRYFLPESKIPANV